MPEITREELVEKLAQMAGFRKKMQKSILVRVMIM